MGRITFTAEPHHEDIISDVESKESIDSTSEAVRHCIERADEADDLKEEIEDLEAEIKQAKAKRDDLQRQLANANQRIDVSNELVSTVRENQSLEKKRATASLVTRTKWMLFGMNETADA